MNNKNCRELIKFLIDEYKIENIQFHIKDKNKSTDRYEKFDKIEYQNIELYLNQITKIEFSELVNEEYKEKISIHFDDDKLDICASIEILYNLQLHMKTT